MYYKGRGKTGMALQLHKKYYGFLYAEEIELKEINSFGRLFFHEKTGARLFYIQNEDDNKVFSISFRTPPNDSTGLPHILEHSVLCGSRKFPAKEPFVELLKGSLNTFLNAMTFADKTMYPVASRNEKDFMNLMDVYLDAVFFPNIYEKPEILMQEGWHYEITEPDGEITYKGVVYNEMKGAFSSPEQVLFRKIQQSLFPDNCYGFESGGDPEVIPRLTQEQFIDFHKKYYHPSNSYIYLYGNGNLTEHLKFLDEDYLSLFEKAIIDSEIMVQEPFTEQKIIVENYPVSFNEKEEEKTFLSLNFAAGKSTDPEIHLSLDILNYLLLETPAAPLKKALMQEGIGKDVFGFYDSSILQPVFSVVAKNSDEGLSEKFAETIFNTLKELAEKGIPKKHIEAAINIREFNLREADYGKYPKGLAYCMKSMESWLYDESPALHLQYESVLQKIRSALTTNYFEDIIKKYLIDNNHRSLLIVKPRKGLTQEREKETTEELAQFKAGLSKEELNRLISETVRLKEFQETPDSPEVLSSIPLLNLQDIEKEAEKLPLIEKEAEGTTLLFHPIFTNEIAYVNLFFDMDGVPEALIQYTNLLAYVLGKINTENYSYEELSNEINIYTGGIRFRVDVFSDKNDYNVIYPKFIIKSAVLIKYLDKLSDLTREIIGKTVYDDAGRLKEILQELKSRMEMSIMNEGHLVAARRATSYFSKTGRFQELCSGISYYQFIDRLLDNYEINSNEIIRNLKKVSEMIFTKENLIISLTAEEKDYETFSKLVSKLKGSLLSGKTKNNNASSFEINHKNEGLMTSSKVQYVAKASNFLSLGYSYSGQLLVMKVIVGYTYLWNKIRVSGGAYGAMANFSRNGDMFFTSYRDPNLKETLAVYNETKNFLRNFDADEREMSKYIIGTISKIDSPLTPSMKGEKASAYYLSNITQEDIQKEREEVLSTRLEDIKNLSGLIKDAMAQDYYCVIGNEGKLKENEGIFNELMEVFK